ncbi:hypothetical protein CHS0354_017051 [Potamilus streckersoni]|uniref:Uncharacterized protein n=1 Tax=Potamilus streckersoni TaxID=2493646 RepID=A0AAE0T036_9BIVA|nr:hypothetical protein CHS0354_017051 [Potamilus streckersoni]
MFSQVHLNQYRAENIKKTIETLVMAAEHVPSNISISRGDYIVIDESSCAFAILVVLSGTATASKNVLEHAIGTLVINLAEANTLSMTND